MIMGAILPRPYLGIVISATVAAASFGSSALAADTRVKAPIHQGLAAPAFNWTGAYIGLHAGHAWGSSDAISAATCGVNPPAYFDCGNQAAVQASGTGSLSPRSFTGGLQIGYNLQNGNLVYGLELDFSAWRLDSSRTVTSAYVTVAPGALFTTSLSLETSWLFTARGRLGWTITPSTLIYATGGLALTEIEVANSFRDVFSAFGDGRSLDIKPGWTIGGGVEWSVAPQWTVKAEYLYVDFGSVSASSTVIEPATSPGASSLLTTSFDLSAHIARAGINYRF